MSLNISKYPSLDMALERLFEDNILSILSILSIYQYYFTVHFSFGKNNEKIMKQ
jgi:hypothetical protein